MSTNAIVTVADGRGFVAETAAGHRYVITAAHCIPNPPQHVNAEDIHLDLVGPLGAVPSMAASLVYFNPVDDVAILTAPDPGRWSDVERFCKLLEAGAFKLAKLAGKLDDKHKIFALGLDGQTVAAETEVLPCCWQPHIFALSKMAAPGMSGSPIWNEAGEAVALLSQSQETFLPDQNPETDESEFFADGPHPLLWHALPNWFWAT